MNPLTQASEPLSEDLYRVRTLIAAIIRQAVDDIKVRPPGKRSKSQVSLAEWERNKNTAVEFLVSESARSYFKFLRIDRDNALTALNLTLEMALHDKDRTLYEVTDEMSDFFERETLIKERADAEPTE